MTTLLELKNFQKENRELFFKKFPRPSEFGARGLWRQATRHLDSLEIDFRARVNWANGDFISNESLPTNQTLLEPNVFAERTLNKLKKCLETGEDFGKNKIKK